MPKSGSGEPEGQPAEGNLRSGSPKANPPNGNLRIGTCRKAEAVSPKVNHRAEESTRRGQSPKRCVPKIGSNKPEGQPAERNLRSGRRKNQSAQRPLRNGACRKVEAVNPKANRRAEARIEAATPSGENHRSPERSPSAGRSRETRGRRSSADTPTNTIEKRDCDTLRPSEAS